MGVGGRGGGVQHGSTEGAGALTTRADPRRQYAGCGGMPGEVLDYVPRKKYSRRECADGLKTRRVLFDGKDYEGPRESRKKPLFSISHVPVTLHFPKIRDLPSR